MLARSSSREIPLYIGLSVADSSLLGIGQLRKRGPRPSSRHRFNVDSLTPSRSATSMANTHAGEQLGPGDAFGLFEARGMC